MRPTAYSASIHIDQALRDELAVESAAHLAKLKTVEHEDLVFMRRNAEENRMDRLFAA